MAHLAGAVVIARQIVVLVVPDEPQGGDGVPFSLPAEDLFLFDVILKVFKGDRFPVCNRSVELVDGVVHALIHALHPAVHIHLPLELAGLVAAGQPLQLADQGVALLPGDEAGGLHHVHQQLQLGQLKRPLPQEPARGLSLAALHVHAQGAQGLHIVINALALGLDVPRLQGLNQLGHRQRMVLVGALPQNPAQAEQLELLICTSRHASLPLPLSQNSGFLVQ